MSSVPDNTSPELDLVTLYSSQTGTAEMEARFMQGILESNGIYSLVTGIAYPPVGYQLRVARSDLEEARRLIAEACDQQP